MRNLTPPRLIILSFLSVICLGTIILSLPIATNGPGRLPLIDSLFTATSATCVTGLIVRDTGSYFSAFGRWVIFLLFQMGGLGIMTFSTLFAVMLGRKIGFRQTEIVHSTLNKQSIVGLKKLIIYIVGITFAIEITGALLLFARWSAVTDWSIIETAERAVFHSVSAFCNAGFALFRASFENFSADPYINLVMIILIVLGGIGFVVKMDIIGLFINKGAARRISLQAKIALFTSLLLIVLGAVVILFFEKEGVLRTLPWGERLWGAFFQSVTARTAGFNTLSIGEFTTPSLLFLIFLMFIGASPGSTGGGIKTCTFAILFVTVKNMLKNNKHVKMFDRTIPRQVVRESLVIFFLGFTWVFVFTIILVYLQARFASGEVSLARTMFEVVSAFGTVGLSTGITESLDSVSKLCLTATMFAGRIGPLTLALAVAFRGGRDTYRFPEENVMVG